MSLRTVLSAIAVSITVLTACGDAPSGDSGSKTNPIRLSGVDLDKKRIRIGVLNAESGPAAAVGKPFAVGKRMLAAQINAGGSGLLPEGWTVELIERDHGYNPQRSVQLFNEIRDDVLFIATSFGTPNTLPLRPMLERHKIVAFPASLSSKMAEFAYTPPFAPSYVVEAMRAMDWAVAGAGGADKVLAGIVYQQDDYGKDGLDGWKKAAAHLGVKIVAEETYAPGQADYTAAISALKKAGATHVLLTTLPSATGPVLGAAAQLDYSPIWIGNTPSWIDRFFDPSVIPAKIFDRYYVVGAGPYWGEPSPFMDEFLALYEKHGKDQAPADTYILASYLQGRTAIEALKRTLLAGPPTREAYLRNLQSLKDYNIEGALAFTLDMTSVPYVVSVETRILQPDMAAGSWKVVAPFASPSSLN